MAFLSLSALRGQDPSFGATHLVKGGREVKCDMRLGISTAAITNVSSSAGGDSDHSEGTVCGEEGRVLATKEMGVCIEIAPKKLSFVAVVAYGYPESHACRGQNEDVLRDIFVSLAGLTCPVLVAGNFNATTGTMPPLALASHFRFYKLSPNTSTTASKHG